MSRRINTSLSLIRTLPCLAALGLLTSSLNAEGLLPKQWGSSNRSAVAESPRSADAAIWKEFGLAATESAIYAGPGVKANVTAYRMKDTTGALAAWEYLRPADSKPCSLSPFCAENGSELLVFDYNYVLSITGRQPTQLQINDLFQQLPEKHESSLPAILTFVPRKNLIANSARYLLGPASLKQFAPELASSDPGFEQGAEGHLTRYMSDGAPLRLALFYYPTPEMARLRSIQFKLIPNAVVKRSSVLTAVVLDAVSEKQADDLLTQVRYEAKITWNDPPPPNQVKILYSLFMNIIIVSCILVALCTLAGLFYAGMRIYRRRFGALESEEAMTTLRLS
jgi:hypothetical protein